VSNLAARSSAYPGHLPARCRAPLDQDIHRFLSPKRAPCRRPEGPPAQEAEVRALRQQSTVPQAPAPDLVTHSRLQPLSASTGRRQDSHRAAATAPVIAT
jgi:hypothetical protein